jgi:hypothetical protein
MWMIDLALGVRRSQAASVESRRFKSVMNE